MTTPTSRVLSGMSHAIFDSDLIATRLTLCLAEVLWAAMLFWPGDTFERPTYSVMGHIAGELWWATAFGISSVLQLSIVLYQQYDAPWARRFAVWNACLWNASVGAMLLGVYPPPAAIGGELALAASSLWIVVRPIILYRGVRKYASSL